jgi:hypothetical protein
MADTGIKNYKMTDSEIKTYINTQQKMFTDFESKRILLQQQETRSKSKKIIYTKEFIMNLKPIRDITSIATPIVVAFAEPVFHNNNTHLEMVSKVLKENEELKKNIKENEYIISTLFLVGIIIGVRSLFKK